MSNQRYISPKLVAGKARTQIECFTKHPDLEKGMPSPLTDLSASFEETLALEAAQESLKKKLVLATRAVGRARFVLREKLRANLAIAALRYGPDAEAVELLGGKPRGGGRRKIKEGTEGATLPSASTPTSTTAIA